MEEGHPQKMTERQQKCLQGTLRCAQLSRSWFPYHYLKLKKKVLNSSLVNLPKFPEAILKLFFYYKLYSISKYIKSLW